MPVPLFLPIMTNETNEIQNLIFLNDNNKLLLLELFADNCEYYFNMLLNGNRFEEDEFELDLERLFDIYLNFNNEYNIYEIIFIYNGVKYNIIDKHKDSLYYKFKNKINKIKYPNKMLDIFVDTKKNNIIKLPVLFMIANYYNKD